MSTARSIVVKSRFPFVPALRIAMRVEGEGDPLLLINGMTRPLRSWDPLIRGMKGRTVVSFDAPGVGDSPTPPRPVSIAGLAAVAAAVLDAAGLDEADVLGFSHGGAVAQELARDNPKRVRRLILVATSCGLGATPGNSKRAILHAFGRRDDDNPWPRPDVVGLFWHSLAISSWSSIPFLGAIKAPTLVVCGSHDRVAPHPNSRVLARRIPGAALVLLPGGHDLQRAVPAKALARVVEDFLPARSATPRVLAAGHAADVASSHAADVASSHAADVASGWPA